LKQPKEKMAQQEAHRDDSAGETVAAHRAGAKSNDGPGSETERFNAVVDPRHNEAVTGESGVPRKQRDHELRCQRESLDEFS
jgi:hypothetical protein